MNDPDRRPGAEAPEEPPPFLGSWRRFYLVVAGNLLGWIVLFYLFQRWFS
ncbi:MAG TPA: hypothetical protein PKN61_09790 [Acidobacteriota bacterium]|jgi:hypothetical protein|nr:hypothetical protein [Acidobacteriota bacterium]HNR39319.1 hypothetical protein [Acidobacteriota bacterium]HNU01730.1 hypothetical protein [Acidobacteriota bacterium]HPB29382.1 hypothetical protein [Acidobacteriota bacterium]HQO24253.1 hypothetical protein [Acidobacteriota bacterium]